MVSVKNLFPFRSVLLWGTIQVIAWFITAVVMIALLFIIGHNLNSVENWISNHCWEIIFVTKLVSLFVWTKLKGLKLSDILSDKSSLSLEGRGLYLVLLFIMCFCSLAFLGGEITSAYKVLNFSGLILIVSKIVFYIVDYIVFMYLLRDVRAMGDLSKIFSVILTCLSCVAIPSMLLSISHSVDLFYVANIIFAFGLTIVLKYSVKVGICFHLLISVPFNLVTIHYNEPYSPLVELTHHIDELECFTMLLALLFSYGLLSKSLLSNVRR